MYLVIFFNIPREKSLTVETTALTSKINQFQDYWCGVWFRAIHEPFYLKITPMIL